MTPFADAVLRQRRDCPGGSKARFRDQATAEAGLMLLQARRRYLGQMEYSERRAYHCPACGDWHLTSEPRAGSPNERSG